MATNKILPWALNAIKLGECVLEIGPGPGVTTEWLRHRVGRVECLEIDCALADGLRERFSATNVTVRCGDATVMPYEDCSFASVVSCTMLHHIPTPELQDRLFREAYRVLRRGGVFAGIDSLPSILMRAFHIGDALTLVAPDMLSQRILSAGFSNVHVDVGLERFRFSAIRPAAAH